MTCFLLPEDENLLYFNDVFLKPIDFDAKFKSISDQMKNKGYRANGYVQYQINNLFFIYSTLCYVLQNAERSAACISRLFGRY